MLIGTILHKMGFKEKCAKDGSEALLLYAKNFAAGQPYVAVILDLNIPQGMGGIETMDKLREVDPKVAGYVMSGDPHHPAMTNFREYGFSGVLEKSFRYEELEKALRKATSRFA